MHHTIHKNKIILYINKPIEGKIQHLHIVEELDEFLVGSTATPWKGSLCSLSSPSKFLGD